MIMFLTLSTLMLNQPSVVPDNNPQAGPSSQVGHNQKQVQQHSSSNHQIPLTKQQARQSKKRLGKQGLHGEIYQLKLLMLFLKRGIDNEYSFRLSTEKKEAKKFDDLFFEITKDGKTEYRLLQAKHKEDDSKKITFDNLLTESDSDYSLVKYFFSYQDSKKEKLFQKGIIKDVTVCTNINLDLDDKYELSGASKTIAEIAEKIENRDDILDIDSKISTKEAVRYRFSHSAVPLLKSKLQDYNLVRLAKRLVECLLKNNSIQHHQKHDIFKSYHIVLAEEVIDVKAKKFHDKFVENKDISEDARRLRKAFIEEIKKQSKEELTLENINKAITNKKKIIDNKQVGLNLSKNFGIGEDKNWPNNAVSDEDVKDFLDHLVFAVNQPDEQQLGKVIENDISKEFNFAAKDYVYNEFFVKMLDWLNGKGEEFISYQYGKSFFDEARQKLSELELTGLTLEYGSKVEKFGINFEQSATQELQLNDFLTSQNSKKIFNVVTEQNTLSAIKVYQVLRGIPGYKKDNSYIFMQLDSVLCLQDRVIQAFQGNNNLLIIECKPTKKDGEEALYKSLKDIIGIQSSKKIILITQKGDTLAAKFKKDLLDKYTEHKDKKDNFIDLIPESQKKLLKEGKVIFQGEEVSLDTLIDEESIGLIDAEVLSKLINNEKIEIGTAPSDLGDIKYYYIDRIFNHQAKIKDEFLRERDIPDLFAISNVGENELSNLASGEKIRKFRNSDSNKDKLIRFVVLDNQNAEEEFKQLCDDYSERTIHWLKKESKDFVLQQSHGTLSELRKFVDTDTRSTSRYPVADRVVIISAEPGMGKSTVLTKLAEKTKKSNPSLWVVRINLNDHTTDLNKVNFGNDNDKDKATNFLLNIADLKTPLEKKLFKHSFSHKGKISLLFDGFDEISPKYEGEVIKLLKILKDTEVEKLWVTTRPHMRNKLEDELGILAHTLEPLSRENQKMFLRKFWDKSIGFSNINEKRLGGYTENLLNLFSKSIVDKEVEFTGIPLQTRMLAEAFEDKFKEFHDSNQDEPNQDESNLPKKLDLVNLYELFIDKKYKIYCEEKKKQDTTNVAVNDDDITLHNNFIQKHKKAALYTLFKEDQQLRLFEDNVKEVEGLIEEIKEGREKTGIISQVIDNKPHFIHRTFVEYFAANWFADNKNLNKQEVKDFLREQIFKEENKVIRNFFDRILAKDEQSDNKDISLENKYEIHVAVLNNDKNKVSKLLSGQQEAGSIINSFDKAGRTSLHLAAAYGYKDIARDLLNELETDQGLKNKINAKDQLFGWSALSYADKGKYWNIAELLLQKGANDDDMLEATSMIKNYNADVKKETLLHIAAQEGYIEFAKVLVEKYADVNARSPSDIVNARSLSDMDQYIMRLYMLSYGICCNYHGTTPLHLAAKNGRLEVTKYLIEVGADINAKSLDGIIHLRMLDYDSPHSYIDDGSTPLHLAAENGQLNVVEYFIEERKVDFEAKDNNGLTLLHRAAGKGKLEVVEYLVEKGADFNLADKDGMTSLHRAAYRDQWEVVKYLVEEGADFNLADKDGMTPLHRAAGKGELEVVKCLVEKKAGLNVVDKNGITPLHRAAYRDRWEVVKYLVKEGADFNLADKDGMTPLHRAAGKGELKVVEYLVEEGADFNLADKNGMTSLHRAAYRDQWEVVKYLVEEGADFNLADKDGMTPLHRAAGKGELKVVEYLVEKGADFNLADKDGMTPLHRAAGKGELEVVKCLVEKKAGLNIVDKNGITPLHRAAYRDRWEVVKYLVEEGADFNLADKDGTTPLHRATGKGELKVVEYLVEKGADFNLADKDGMTPLHRATGKGELKVVEYLVEKGADFNLADKDGMTPLHRAAGKGELKVVEYLVEKGADFNLADKDGMTPLHWAASFGSLELVKYLVDEKEVDFNIADKDGMTPLHWATASGHLELVKYLVDEKKVGFNTKANSDITPLDIAVFFNHSDIVRYFVGEKSVTSSKEDVILKFLRAGVLTEEKFKAIMEMLKVEALMKGGFKTIMEMLKVEALMKGGFKTIIGVLRENFKAITGVLRGALTEEKFKAIMGVLEEVLREEVLTEEKLKAMTRILREEDFEVIMEELREVLTEEKFKAIKEALREENLKAIRRMLKEKQTLSPGRLDISSTMHSEAVAHFKQGKYDEALKTFQELLNKEKLLDPDHPNTLSTMRNIAAVLFKQGKYDKALEAFQELLNKQKQILSHNHPNILQTERDIDTVHLHRAASSGDLNLVKELVEKGNNVNAKGAGGGALLGNLIKAGAILHVAAKNGYLEIVDALLKVDGIDVNAKDAGGRTPLYYAAQNGHWEVVDALLKVDGIDVNANQGATLLHLAASNGKLDVVKYLIEKGVDVNAKIDDGRTLIHLAAKNGNLNIVKYLIDQGVDFNAPADDGSTPLHLADRNGKVDIVMYLKEKKADFNTPDKDYITLLHIAAQYGNLEVVKDLIENKKADINAKTNDGSTPLHLATKSGKLDVVEYLAAKGADVNAKDNENKTPSDVAGNNKNIVDFLKRKGGKKGKGCAIQAYEKQQKAFVRLGKYIDSQFPEVELKAVKQGLYLPSFESRNVEISGKCAAITRVFSQGMFLEGEKGDYYRNLHKLLLSNVKTSEELYERIAQGKKISTREEREIFDLSRLLDTFEQQLDSPTSSLPSDLSHIKSYKTFDDLSRYLSDLPGDFSIHLVTSNHVIAIYRTGDNYVYFDSNVAFVSNLKSVYQLIRVLEKAVTFAGYELAEDGFLVEHLDVTKANNELTTKQKQILTKPIQAERHLLFLQDQRLGHINLNGKQVSRVTLYDLGTKLHLEGSSPILINSDMNLSNKNLLAYLNTGKISITAREYLESSRNNPVEKTQELVQTTKAIPFAGSRNEIKHAQQIQELLSSDIGSKLKSYELGKLLKSPIEKSIKALPYYLEVANSKHWPNRLTNAAGRIQLIRGIHGAAVSCNRERGNTKDCLLNTGEISLSLVSQLIEDKVVQNVPKLIKSLKTVKFGTHILRGGAAIVSSPFDVYDLIDSAIDLHNCEKGSSECKDAIAGVTFASTSLASGVVLTAIGAPGVGTAVGLVIMVAQGAYGGGRTIEEFQPYRLTFDENFRLFWHAFALQPVPTDIEYIKARKDIVSQITKQVWEQLQSRNEHVVAHVTGLGDITFKEERECKPVQEGLDSYQSCTHRKVRVPTLFPSNATMLMDLSNIKGNDYQRFLSRVLPDSPSQDAVVLCLPAFSGKDYERDYTLSNGYPRYESSSTVTSYCENAMMIGDKRRLDQVINKKVVFDLNLVDQGVVVGSDKWQNDFIVSKGKVKVLGGENTRNTFILTDKSFAGTIFSGRNSTNTLDVSNLGNYSLHLDNNLSNFDRVSYVLANKRQTDNSKAYFYGINNVVISANVTAKGNGNEYNFYIKPAPGYSKIDISKGFIIFPETALLLDCERFTYSPENNVLSMKFGNFTLDIGNYFNRDKKICNFELIDKYGSSIGPLIDLEQSNSQEVKLFNLRTETALTYNNVTKWYEGIAKANKEYQVYGTVKVKYPIAQEKYGSYPNMIFGTSGSDIIPVTKETWYTEGKEGSDSYNVMPSNSSIVTEVNNYAEDGMFDLLYMPVNSIQVSRDNNSLHLYAADSTHSVKVKDYFVNGSYQHLTVIDENKDVFVPLVNLNHQSNVQLIPFYHAIKDQYMFSLSAEKVTNSSEIIVDAKLDNIKFYKNGSNLLLVDDKPIMIKLENFYDQHESWQNLTINFWRGHNKGKLNSQQLFELAKLAINYQDEIRNTYYDSVKEYIVPTSNATIHHNQELTNGTLATVEPNTKRVGVLVLQDPSGIEVSVNNEDLVFFVGQNNTTFTIKNWNDTDHRVSTLRFNQAIEISRLDKFDLSQVSEIQSLINKAALSSIATKQLEKLDSNVANGIKYLLAVRGIENDVSTYKCLGFDSVEEEQQFISAYHSRYSLVGFDHILGHSQGVEALVWLIVKGYSNLSLESHNVDRRSLLNNLDKCFNAAINKRTINRIMRKLEVEDLEAVVPNVESFVKRHKEALEDKIVSSLRSNTTEITGDIEEHRRKRRDESEVKGYEDQEFFNAQNDAIFTIKATSGAGKLSSWISDLFGWAKSSITGFLAPSTEQVSGNIVQPEISNAFVDGFLMLSDVGVRKLTGNKYKQPKYDSLLSPKELIEKRIDYTAIEAINNLGSMYNATKMKVCDKPITYLKDMSLEKSNVEKVLHSSPQPSLKEIAIESVNKCKVI